MNERREFQFVPQRERSVLPLERKIGKCCREKKRLFTGSVIWSTNN